MLSSIKTIIFDLGGVLVDLDRDRSAESFTEIGFPEAAKLIDCYHPAEIFNQLERGEIGAKELYDHIRTMSGCEISDKAICDAYSEIVVKVPQYKLRMLDNLRSQGYKIVALSNINEVVMPKVRRLFEADGKSMEQYFDYLYLSYEMKTMKPDAEIFEQLIAHSGVKPEETLYIDDSKANVEAGAAMGFNVYLAAAFEDFSHIFE